MRCWWPCLLLALAGGAMAQDDASQAATPRGDAAPVVPPRDREFGVSTRKPGLARHVEMYQWRRSGAGYAKVWSEAPIDSDGFADGHANPGTFALQARYWIASRVELDGKPLDEDVLKALGTWRPFRPGFSALPGNLAATFQPEGDGLGSAENPLDPQVGDLRVTWRELVLPSLRDRVVLQDGTWVLKPTAVGVAADRGVSAQVPPEVGTPHARKPRAAWWWIGGAVLVLLAAAFLFPRRRRRAS